MDFERTFGLFILAAGIGLFGWTIQRVRKHKKQDWIKKVFASHYRGAVAQPPPPYAKNVPATTEQPGVPANRNTAVDVIASVQEAETWFDKAANTIKGRGDMFFERRTVESAVGLQEAHTEGVRSQNDHRRAIREGDLVDAEADRDLAELEAETAEAKARKERLQAKNTPPAIEVSSKSDSTRLGRKP